MSENLRLHSSADSPHLAAPRLWDNIANIKSLTALERLHLESCERCQKTDATIRDAIFQCFVAPTGLTVQQQTTGTGEDIDNQSINVLHFSTRVKNRLERPYKWNRELGKDTRLPPIRTIGELCKFSGDELLEIDKFGEKCLTEVRKKLEMIGRKLRSDP